MMTSIDTILKALTVENRRLLSIIHRHKPTSVAELCALSGKTQPNVSRALATLVDAGLVRMSKTRPKRPEIVATSVTIDLTEQVGHT